MTLETASRRFTLLPGFIQTGNGEPRKAHWLGNKQTTTPQQNTAQGGHDDRPPSRPDPRAYRPISSITLGEVDEAYSYFRSQLVASPAEGWIAKNYFCQVPLALAGSKGPPALFGRVRTCFPGDGYIHNIHEVELYFPHRQAEPDVVHLQQDQVLPEAPTSSYCVAVKMCLSEDELADFRSSENIFIEKGFAPIYESGYLDLLELTEQNRASLPWLHVIGSGWLASIPHSVQLEVRAQLRELVRWNPTVFNYHPRRYSLRSPSLNEELDFQYGFTEQYLVTPQNTEQTLKKLDETFAAIFMQGMP